VRLVLTQGRFYRSKTNAVPENLRKIDLNNRKNLATHAPYQGARERSGSSTIVYLNVKLSWYEHLQALLRGELYDYLQ